MRSERKPIPLPVASANARGQVGTDLTLGPRVDAGGCVHRGGDRRGPNGVGSGLAGLAGTEAGVAGQRREKARGPGEASQGQSSSSSIIIITTTTTTTTTTTLPLYTNPTYTRTHSQWHSVWLQGDSQRHSPHLDQRPSHPLPHSGPSPLPLVPWPRSHPQRRRLPL